MVALTPISTPPRYRRHAPGTVPAPTTCYAVLYRRVSSDEQEREGVSLDAQLAEIRRYAVEKGWVIAGEYVDVLSGTRDDRPDYVRLLRDVRAMRAEGKHVAVVVAALDRFGRRIVERVRSRAELKQLGVPTHSVREGGEVDDLRANILASVAEEEVRRLGERVSKSWEYIMSNGWHFVGQTPWGYRLREATKAERLQGAPAKVLEIDEVAAPYVREAFERFAAGEPLWSVVRFCMALAEDVRGSRSMTYVGTRGILMSSTYVGRHKGAPGDTAEAVLATPVQRWPALVSDDVWLAVQQRIERNRRIPTQASNRYLLTGFLRCARCGARMAGRVPTAKPNAARYVCTGKNAGLKAKDFSCYYTLAMGKLDEVVRAEVSRVLEPLTTALPLLQRQLEKEWVNLQRDPDVQQRDKQIAGLEARRDTAKRRLTDASLKLVEGILNQEAYSALQERLTADLHSAEQELSKLLRARPPADHRLPPLADVLKMAGSWHRIMCDAPVSAQREVLSELVESITPHRLGKASSRAQYAVEIRWTPLGEQLSKLARQSQLAK